MMLENVNCRPLNTQPELFYSSLTACLCASGGNRRKKASSASPARGAYIHRPQHPVRVGWHCITLTQFGYTRLILQSGHVQCQGGGGPQLPSTIWPRSNRMDFQHVKNLGRLIGSMSPISPTFQCELLKCRQ